MAEDMNLQINITGQNNTGNSFSSLDAALADLQKLATDVSKVFDDFAKTVSSSMSTASKSVQDMTAPLQSERTELEAMVQSMGDVDRAAQTMGTTAAQAGREMQTSMEGATQAGRAMESGLAGTQQVIRNTGDAVTATSSSVDRLGQALSAEMIGEQLKQIGETGLKVFESAVHSAADFEFNISRIGAVLTTVGKATNGQMSQMSDDALKIGSTSSFSANQIAEGMYTLARQGLDASTILGDGVNGAINIVNDLAQATDSSMTDTATVITDVVHEYNLSGAELRNVANIMSGTLHNSSESLDDFYQSMKQVGPVASNMHQNVNDVSTALALLAQRGITGSRAGTSLTNMLLGLEPRTKKAAGLMKELGISAKDGASDSFYKLDGTLKGMPDIIDILNQKFGGLNDKQKQAAIAATFTKYGLSGLNVIVGESRDKFLAFQNELRADDAATIAAKKMDNLHGDMLKFNAGMQTMMKSFGDSINGMLRPIVQGASQAIKWITELPKPAKEAGMILVGLGSALAIAGGSVIAFAGGVRMLGPSLAMAGMSTAGFEAAAASLGAIFTGVLIPVALVVAAVAVLALGFKLAYDHIKPFHDLVNQVGERLKTFVQTLMSAILPVFQNVFNTISKTVMDAFNIVVTTIGNGLQTVYAWWMQYWPEIQQVFVGVWDVMKYILGPTVDAMKSMINAGIAFIKGAWQNGWAAIGDIFRMAWDIIKGVVQTAWAIISGIVSVGLDLLTGHFQKAGSDFVSTLRNAFNAILGMFSSLIGDALNFGSNFAQSIAKGITGAIGSVVGAAQGLVNSVKSAVGNGVSGVVNGAKSLLTAPHFATGGILTSPTYALVGEAGPEAIIPLSDPSRGLALWQQAGEALGVFSGGSGGGGMALPSSSGGGGNININVYANGNITRNEHELGQIVSRAILNQTKLQGRI